ncbi:membrane protein insertion efficiency factor YidD [Neptunicella sp. SCSIO 80796]|uniref:membrane protein insertion efficiency factor YidD n=1 Tax=Neptunicella plasticusilytica TaxID=3117012 RepID=UPI003A4DF0AA
MEKNISPLQSFFICLIKGYQRWLSPILGQQCRFHPTCSHYSIEAIKVHGSWIGCWLTVKRILKCQPLHSGGFDPVPPKQREMK